jgi:hypothetical protein
MDTTAALTPPEIAALSDAERLCDLAAHLLQTTSGPPDRELSVFEESLRLKNTLDAFEEQGGCVFGSQRKWC